jgi:phage N-6-adenine-methyltransferase
MTLSRALFSSTKDNWETPPELFARLDRQWGPFTLDAAADHDNTKCAAFIQGDAFEADWAGHARVWINPPYGRGVIKPWVRRALRESHNGRRVVMLLPARTDSEWFHELVIPHAFHIGFIRGRVRFVGASSGAPFPSMVVVFEASS